MTTDFVNEILNPKGRKLTFIRIKAINLPKKAGNVAGTMKNYRQLADRATNFTKRHRASTKILCTFQVQCGDFFRDLSPSGRVPSVTLHLRPLISGVRFNMTQQNV